MVTDCGFVAIVGHEDRDCHRILQLELDGEIAEGVRPRASMLSGNALVVRFDHRKLALGFRACCPGGKHGFRASLAFPLNFLKLFIGEMF